MPPITVTKPPPTASTPRLHLWWYPGADAPRAAWDGHPLWSHPGVVPIIREFIGAGPGVNRPSTYRPPGYPFRPATLEGWADSVCDHLEYWGQTKARYGDYGPICLYPAYWGSRFGTTGPEALLVDTRLYTHPSDAYVGGPFRQIAMYPQAGLSATIAGTLTLATTLQSRADARGVAYPRGWSLDWEPYQNPPYQGPHQFTAAFWAGQGDGAWPEWWADARSATYPIIDRGAGGTLTFRQAYLSVGSPPINPALSSWDDFNAAWFAAYEGLFREAAGRAINLGGYQPWRAVFPGSSYFGNWDMGVIDAVGVGVANLDARFRYRVRSAPGATHTSQALYGFPTTPGSSFTPTYPDYRAYMDNALNAARLGGLQLCPYLSIAPDSPLTTWARMRDHLAAVSDAGGCEAIVYTTADTDFNLDELLSLVQWWWARQANASRRRLYLYS